MFSPFNKSIVIVEIYSSSVYSCFAYVTQARRHKIVQYYRLVGAEYINL